MARRILLCERTNDEAFFRALIAQRGLPEFEVTYPTAENPKAPGGRSGYTQRLRALKFRVQSASGLLVTVDCDESAEAAFKRAQASIAEAGEFGVPPKVLEAAQSAGDLPPVVVLTIPPGEPSGQLETLCLRALRSRWTKHAECVDRFKSCLPLEGWSPGKLERMELRALIASICKMDPNTSLQHAWRSDRPAGLIPLEDPCFDAVADALAGFDALCGLSDAAW